MSSTHAAAEWAARESYGRLVAYLSARCRDLAAVEDAISQSLLLALEQWPNTGIPEIPEAWLLTVARRRLLDQQKSAHAKHLPIELFDLPHNPTTDEEPIPDERLKLMFVCTHPAIDVAVQVPLMLQTVLGFDAETIAKAFVVPATTMGQRLVRAKSRIRELAIPFQVPPSAELASRFATVLQAVYVLYANAWSESLTPAEPPRLASEAIHLARMLIKLVPHEPEPLGLLALTLHSEARRPARHDEVGRYIPLLEQDTNLWSRDMMQEAENHLWRAATMQQVGRFQLEAAIQSAHNRRAFDGQVPWADIDYLYELLVSRFDSLGARVAWAATKANHREPERGVEILDAILFDAMKTYQPYWAVRAHLLDDLGQHHHARECYENAIRLTTDNAVKRYLQHRMLKLD